MNTCCETASPRREGDCPRCGERGLSVERLTVAALTTIVVPVSQAYWLCRSSACEVVYFAEDGTLIPVSATTISSEFKTKSPESLVCHCFLHQRRDIEAELVAKGETTIPDRIAQAVRAGNCACEVRNPTGRCCLGEVGEAIGEIRAEIDGLTLAART